RTPPHLRRDRLKDRSENLTQYGAERLDERVHPLRAPCGLSFAAASCLARRHSHAILGGGPDHLEAILHSCSRPGDEKKAGGPGGATSLPSPNLALLSYRPRAARHSCHSRRARWPAATRAKKRGKPSTSSGKITTAPSEAHRHTASSRDWYTNAAKKAEALTSAASCATRESAVCMPAGGSTGSGPG